MRKIAAIFTMAIIIFSCSDNKVNNKELLSKITQLEQENKELKETIELLQYPPSSRLSTTKNLIADSKFNDALSEMDNLQKLFPQSKEASEIENLRKVISDKQLKAKQEEDRIKALGFKVLKEQSNIKVGYNNITIGSFSTAQTFTFDSYDDRYHYSTADRGNKYISARISITSSDKDPMLPLFYAYNIKGDKLELIGSFILKFARWRDYGSYLGNYTDNGNDFSKVSTIPFKIGLEISDELSKEPIVIVVRNENCLNRNYNRFDNPPVSYSGRCHSSNILTIEDLKEDFLVVKILNKNKL